MKAKMSGKALLLLIPAVTAVGVTSGVVLAASTKADFTIASSPATRSVEQGQTAIYTVTVGSLNGFSSGVQLSASNLPVGATVSFSPTQVSKGMGTASMSVVTSTSTPTTPSGSDQITVTGTSGSTQHSTTVNLVVTDYVAPAFAVSGAPAVFSGLPGDTATYHVTVSSPGSVSVALSTIGTLPSGVAVAFTPATVSTASGPADSTMTVTTKSNTASGNYTLTVAGNSAGQAQQTTTVGLNLSGAGRAFTVTVPAFGPFAPGDSFPLDLAITNPNNQSLLVTNLSGSIQAVSKAAGVTGTCTTGDYAVSAFGGSYPLTIPAGATRTLSQLGVPSTQEPAVSMPDSVSTSQDGCRGASVTVSFTGSGQGA